MQIKTIREVSFILDKEKDEIKQFLKDTKNEIWNVKFRMNNEIIVFTRIEVR